MSFSARKKDMDEFEELTNALNAKGAIEIGAMGGIMCYLSCCMKIPYLGITNKNNMSNFIQAGMQLDCNTNCAKQIVSNLFSRSGEDRLGKNDRKHRNRYVHHMIL